MYSWEKLLNPKRQYMSCKESDDKTLVSDNDYRSEFQKDFDTICNSSSLRRLQSKAQVFPLEREDFFRTRLTHSIEVMSIAESMGYSIIEVINKKEREKESDICKYIKDIPTILKSAALIHDLGNPPFGHISEGVISKWFEENLSKLYFKGNKLVFNNGFHDKQDDLKHILTNEQVGDFINFDGNAQSLRIITHLQNPIKFTGMNLTYPIMATIIKYPCDPITKRDFRGKTPIKKDYFLQEKEIYLDIQKVLELNHARHPLVYLLEASDDIAYLTADIEDACRKRLINVEDIYNECKKVISKLNQRDALIEHAITIMEKYKRLLNNSKNGVLDEHDEVILIRQFRAQIKGKMISEAIKAFEKNYDLIMNGIYKGELLKEDNLKNLRDIFSNLLKTKVYYSKEIVKSKIESCKIISTLLSNYILSIFNYDTKNKSKTDDEYSLIYNTLSVDFKRVCLREINKFRDETKKDNRLSSEEKKSRIQRQTAYCNLLLAVDQISGMTDTYAFDAYHIIKAL